MEAQKVSRKAAAVGFEWETVEDVWAKVAEERAEFEAEDPRSEARAMEFGDMLFALVNVARKEGIERRVRCARAPRSSVRVGNPWRRGVSTKECQLRPLRRTRLNELWDHSKRG